MTTTTRGLVAAFLLALVAPATAETADSTEAIPSFVWVAEDAQARALVVAAETEEDIHRQRVLASTALAAAESLVPRTARALVQRAQAVHDEHHLPDGTVRPAGDILATRAALAAEHARADGPDYLFYPAAAADLVERQRHAARQLASSARRGHRLLGTIERMLRQRGLPADLRFVAVIESALNPSAESWAGAQGIWQFMPQTAADMGLDSLSVRDPVASTAAAARYLRWLGHEFDGDWQLALAAYNYGIGRVARLVREYEEAEGVTPTFWDLHDRLPRETQEYVPRFIAVAEVLGARGEA